MKNLKTWTVLGILTISLGACANTPKWQKGAAIGAGVGAGTGAIIGHQSGHKGTGAAVGAGVGAVTGGLIGALLDKQQAELEEVAEVERTSEEELVVTLRERILFDTDKYSLKPGAQDNLVRIAEIVKKYPDFDVAVEGHTDSTGSENYNQWLSEKRAEAVSNFLEFQGVNPNRIHATGMGEMRPVATNETAEGRQQNRRVEMHITPLEAPPEAPSAS